VTHDRRSVTNQAAELTLAIDVKASAQATWDAVTDWAGQSAWMLGTTTEARSDGGQGVGAQLAARTGIGPIGFWDTMVITEWQPPRICAVRHTGRVVRGTGIFRVESTGPATSRFIWSEQVDLPFGRLGRLGWALAVRPATAAGVGFSLRRFARWTAHRAPSCTVEPSDP
jgi:hypothetical protein